MKGGAQDPWNFLFIAGMWFQDLFNYDFRRTEMCIIPYGTQQGEISFCAYNTGVGWRNIIENMHKNATVAEWYKNHRKHEIYAKGTNSTPGPSEHPPVIDPHLASPPCLLVQSNSTRSRSRRLIRSGLFNNLNPTLPQSSGFHASAFFSSSLLVGFFPRRNDGIQLAFLVRSFAHVQKYKDALQL